jgi:hypothetical protein
MVQAYIFSILAAVYIAAATRTFASPKQCKTRALKPAPELPNSTKQKDNPWTA